MNRTRNGARALALSAMAGLVAFGVGCRTAHHERSEPVETHTTEVKQTHSGIYSPRVGDDQSVVGLAFPTGEVDSSALLLHQVLPRVVSRGDAYPYEYHVTNLTGGTLQNVVVSMETADNMTLVDSTPSGVSGSGGVAWPLGDLGPHETKVIRMSATSNDLGSASNCVSVSYNNSLCAVLQVVEPDLTIAKTATRQAMLCDMIALNYQVCNPGTGVARNVRVTDQLPRGVTTAEGASSVDVAVGDLAPGECRDIQVMARASGTGTFDSAASASADGNLSAASETTSTVIVQPELAIAAQCRDDQYLGRNATFEYVVTNTGNGPANDAVVTINYPTSASFVRSSAGGIAGAGQVVWSLGSLDMGESQTVSLTLSSAQIGAVRTSATVNASCAEAASDTCTVEFKGIAAILLEVIDIEDPVEVGQQTTYVIRVTNQGSAPDTNIGITCALPDELQFVSAGGATNGSSRGSTVTFSPYGTLAPGQVIEWRLVVKATGEGDVRFGVEMTSDRLTSPVRETEATNLYR